MDSWQVDTLKPEICLCLCKLGQANDWPGVMTEDLKYSQEYRHLVCELVCEDSLNRINGYKESCQVRDNTPVISIEKAIEILSCPPPNQQVEASFCVDGHTVKINKNKITIGCITITKGEVCEVYDKMVALQ